MTKRNFSHSRGPSPVQGRLQLVQAHFGLSQQRVADLLNVTRSTLAMDERGQRLMPMAAYERLDALRQQLPAPYGPEPEAPEPGLSLTEAEQQELRRRRRKITLEEYPLQLALERSQTQLRQARLRLHVLPGLRAAFSDEWGQLWLNTFEAEARVVLEYDAGTPALLQLRLRVLAFEAAEITKLLGNAAPREESAG
ncbi:hypothetical protein [Hymenobacter algoricola]|uniref:HTH cro/C1-type domain-containing protein n=1 Tax=Hymenobacter algoricola TaxID=486267 RepID=A0ABP7N1X3_9BACT